MTDRNREVTLKFIEAMGSNDAQGAAECLAPDGMAVTKGFSKASGTRKAGTVVEAIESFKALMPTGLRLEIPDGFEVQVRPRSGLALKHGVTLPNSPGTIDSDYRGELGVIVLNAGQVAFTVQHGERIAQLVVAPVVQAGFTLAEGLSETARGDGGFGSTGRG